MDYNKVDKALKSIGISVKDATGQFRNFDDIIMDLGSVWNDLDRNTQRYVATVAAGSRQQSRFIALLENYDRVVELQEIAADSAGRADEQFAKYADTLEYKINQLKNSWEQLRTEFLNSDFFKGVVDSITNFVNKIKDLDGVDIASIAIIGMTLGKAVIKNFISSIQSSTNEVRSAMDAVLQKGFGTVGKGLKTKLKIGIDEEDLESKIASIKGKILDLAQSSEIELGSMNDDTFKIIEAYQKIGLEIDKVEKEQIELKNTSKQSSDEQQKEIDETIAKLKLLRAQQAVLQKNFQSSTGASEGATGKFFGKLDNEANVNLVGTLAQKERKDAWTGALSDATKSAITTGIMAAITSKDVKTAATTMGVTFATSMTPQLVSSLSSGLKTFATSHPYILVGTIVAATIATAFTVGMKKYKESIKTEKQKLQEELNDAESTLKDLQSNEQDFKGQAKEAKESYENVSKLKEEYDELSKKALLTTEEQEKYNELVEQIRNDYPEIVSSYNEVTGELKTQNELWDSIIEKAKKSADEAQISANTAAYIRLSQEENIENIKTRQQLEALSRTALSASSTGAGNLAERSAVILQSNNGDLVKQVQELEATFEVNLQEVAKLIGVDVNTNSGAEELLQTIVANTENEDLIRQAGIDNIDELENNINNFNEGLENQKNLVEEEISSKKNLLAKEALLADTIAQKFGVSGATATFTSKFIEEEMGKVTDEQTSELVGLISGKTAGRSKIQGAIDFFGSSTLLGPTAGTIAGAFSPTSILADQLDIDNDIIRSSTRGLDFDELIEELAKNNENNLTKEDFQEIFKSFYGVKTLSEAKSKYEETTQHDITDLANDEAFASTIAFYLKENLAKALENLSSEEDSFVQTWTEKMGDATYEELQGKIEELKNGIKDKDAANIIATAAEKTYETQFETASKGIIETLGKDFEKEIKGSTLSEITAFREYLTGLSEVMGDTGAANYVKALWSTLSKYKFTNEEKQKIARAIDWSSASAANMESFRKQSIETVKEITGLTEKESAELFDKMAAQAENSQLLDKTVSTTGELEELIKGLQETSSKAYAQKDTFLSVINSQAENGVISLQEYLNLEKAITELGGDINDFATIGANGTITLNAEALRKYYLSQVTYESKLKEQIEGNAREIARLRQQLDTEASDASRENIRLQIEEAQDLGAELQKAYEKAVVSSKAYTQEILDNLIKAKEEAQEAYNEALKAEQKAQEALDKAKAAKAEKEKALYETIYGSGKRASGFDDMYNYDTNYNRAKSLADEAKNALSDLQDTDNAKEVLQKYIDNVHKETAIGEAEVRVLEQAIENGQKSINSDLVAKINNLNQKYGENIAIDVKDLYSEINGRFNANIGKIEALKIPEEYKKMLKEEITSWNENLEKIDEIQKKKLERQKEFNEAYKKSLQDVVNLQQEMADALKEKYQKEIDDVTDKYNAMKEADDNYLDALEKAIQKERDLRDTQNKWDDLAQKEKKLSLLQRDTSGSNQIERQKLEKEIQSDRTSLLDESVDNVVDELKELYETQQEEREAELEVLNALIDEAAIMKEVVEALANITSSDELVAWFEQMTDTSAMSNEQIELQKQGWADLFQAKETYLELSKIKFDEAMETSEKEINDIVNSTSETLTTKADSTLNEVTDSVDKSIQSAEDALNAAIQDVTDRTNDLADASANVATKLENLEAANKKYFEAIKDAATDAINSILNLANIALGSQSTNNPVINPVTGKSYQEENARALQDRQDKGISGLDAVAAASAAAYGDSERKNRATTIVNRYINNWTKDGKLDSVNIPSNKVDNLLDDLDDVLGKGEGNYTIIELNDFLKSIGLRYKLVEDMSLRYSTLSKYAKGGLVNYTGPAWVDGSPTSPEAFLSSEDTRRIGEAARILADLPILNTKWSSDNITTTNVGDTNVEINITVEGDIKDESTVDYLMEQVERKIVSTANYTGANVILHR